jgi:aspartyl-tRNA(Asn)/glutamyl-tRNA(Gln) amidotransferase subunit A
MDSIFCHRGPDGDVSGSGPLEGVRVAVQPNISVQGWPADAGSTALENFTALEDAGVIIRLREAGAVICGSTRMSEFGFGLSGSRAGEALTEKAADVEMVLDLMGEGRMAAAQAGTCGFKASYGLVSSLGLTGLIPSMESIGLLASDAGLIRETLTAVAGPDSLDFSQPDEPALDFSAPGIKPESTRIGIISEAADVPAADVYNELHKTAEELAQAGFSVQELSLADMDLFSLVHNIVGSVEASSCAGRYDSVRYGHREPGAKNWNQMFLRSRGASFGSLIKSYLFQGAYFQFERYQAYEDACRIRSRLVADMEKLFKQADFLLLPARTGSSRADPGSSLADTYEQFAATLFANVSGQPVLYLPPAPGTNAFGCQLAGRRRSDPQLLALGEYVVNLRQGGNA